MGVRAFALCGRAGASVCVRGCRLTCARTLATQFNDNTVSESTWESLCVESVGGHHNTSAYCLVYIDCNRSELMDGERLSVSQPASLTPATAVTKQRPVFTDTLYFF